MMKTRASVLNVVGLAIGLLIGLLEGPAAAQQTILVQEDFEAAVLPTGWTHWPGGPNPGCSEVHYLDAGLSGTSLVMASSDNAGCYQATGVETGPIDISGCTEVGAYWLLGDLGDEDDSCPLSWTDSSPPEGDCFGASWDGINYLLVEELVGYPEYVPVPFTYDAVGVFPTPVVYLYWSEYDDLPPRDDGIALDDVTVVCDPEETACEDGLDNDYDGRVDCDDPDCHGIDDDNDGMELCDGDCDDGDATVYLYAPELCDGIDNDCDGLAEPSGSSYFYDFSDALQLDDFVLNGSAVHDAVNGWLELTDASANLAAAAWLDQPIYADQFLVTFDFFGGNGTGGDGFTLSFQEDGTGHLGDAGGGLGMYGHLTGLGYGIEFDTYADAWDPDANHVATMVASDPGNHVDWVTLPSTSTTGPGTPPPSCSTRASRWSSGSMAGSRSTRPTPVTSPSPRGWGSPGPRVS